MLEHILDVMLEYAVPACEIVAVVVIVFSVVKAVIFAIHNLFTPNERDFKIDLLSGLSLGLEFAMAGEILKTLMEHTMTDLLQLGIVVVMRILFTFVLHREIKDHKKHKSGQTEQKETRKKEKEE